MKWKMKNNLDEMQEIKLRGIERNGCWFAFWALLAAMMIQLVLGAEVKQMAGEWIVFMCLALYIGIACMRAGIWDRHIPATPLANLICSLIAGVVVWGLNIAVMVRNGFFDHLKGAVIAAGVIGVFTFVLCFAALSICTALYKKRVKKLEEEPEDDMHI